MSLRNRVFMCPMGTPSEVDRGIPERAITYFVARAKGGTGLIITGGCQATTKFEEAANYQLDSFRYVDRVNFLAEQIHQYGAKLCVQITPGLGRVSFANHFTPPYSASATPAFWFPKLTCKPLEIEDIKHLVKAVGFSALLAKKAGADAVELHAYGGYLIDQFQSEIWNQRTDAYGGDLQGRMKFTLEIIAEIQRKCGSDYPLIVKFTPLHGIPGGRELTEGVAIAKILEAAGVQALHVDKGCYERWYHAIPTVYQEEANQIEIARTIKEAVNIPVLAQGKLGNPETAERVLKEGYADYIGLGHNSLTDPEWVNKIQEGRTYDIRPCIGCNECLYSEFSGKYMSCAVNPQCFHEKDYPVLPGEDKKSILVIGGGPGGMQAAATAAERGFNVELWEKGEQLGGNLLTAGAPYFKKDIRKYIEYLKNRLYQLNVNVRLMKSATADDVIKNQYDCVIMATGARPIVPRITGIDGPNVRTSDDILLGLKDYGKKVVIIGGGLVGCETALQVERDAEEITIIEALPDILATVEHSRNNDQALRTMVVESKIQLVTGAKVTAITPTCVEYSKEGVSTQVECDTIVIAVGYQPNNELADALADKVKTLKVIGDADQARKIINAVHEGFHAVRVL